MAAKTTFSFSEIEIVSDALSFYKGEVLKVMKKCEKIGLTPEAEKLKEKFLEIEQLCIKVTS